MQENYSAMDQEDAVKNLDFKILADAYQGKYKILKRAKERSTDGKVVLTVNEQNLMDGFNKIISPSEEKKDKKQKRYGELLAPEQHGELQEWEAKIKSLELGQIF